ncbi:MAG TPA: LuxR C-terminal-related transcriptional regulator, partial [Candidatus Sulfotelmatobacter sp.]|nr:LuxR C-terminal-related transcriptional regulator [Candidatus Sulfotelmatobacter sp.]
APRFRHGAVLIELAPLADPSLIPQAILQALGVGDVIGPSPEETVVAAVREAEMLLVFDNCEHLADGCASLVERLLRSSGGARVIATSREPLDVEGEVTLAVPPLSLPPPDAVHTAGRVAEYEAIRLFTDRVAAALPGFALDDANADSVARLCRRLDGLPLALELAAVRMRSMSAAEILEHIDDRFSLLRRTRRGGPSRHQTLRATIDWSHDLLSEPERILFRRLSVFADGWTLDDAEAIASCEPLPRDSISDLHTRLVDKSLVFAQVGSDRLTRYGLLETLRHYAAERLTEADEDEHLRRRHFDHFLSVVEHYDESRQSRGSDAGLRLLAEHRDNLRAALDWAATVDVDAALRLTAILDDFWRMISAAEGWQRLQQTLPAASRDSPHRLRALLTAGMLAAYIPAYAEGAGLLHEARVVARRRGDYLSEAWADLWLGRLAFFGGDPHTAEDHLARAAAAHESLGSALGLVRSLSLIGLLRALILGERIQGKRDLERAAMLSHDIGDSWGKGYAHMMLGLCAADAGDLDGAISHCQLALAATELGPLLGVPLLALAQAGLAKAPGRAVRILGAAAGHFQRTGTVTPPFLQQRSDDTRRLAEQLLGVQAAARGWEEGRRMTTDEAVAYAVSHPAHSQPPSAALSRREAQVAAVVARGHTNREIADALHISVRTVESHLNHILTRLQLRNRTELAAWGSANLDTETT